MIDYTRLQELLLILENFFWASCSQEKSPHNITGEIIFKKSYLLSRVIFCFLKVSSPSRKVKAINQQKVLANVKFQASSLPKEMI